MIINNNPKYINKMNTIDKLNQYDSDNFSVIEKRQFVRELIKEKIVNSVDASSTNSMKSSTCDDIIYDAQNGNSHYPKATTKPQKNKNNIGQILSELQNALDSQNTAVDTDIIETMIDEKTDSLKSKIDDNKKSIIDATDKVEELLKVITAGSNKKLINKIKAKASNNVILEKLNFFYDVGTESNQNVLLLSPPSFGKSHAVRLMGSSYDHFIEHNCSDDMDENANLIGSTITDSSGQSKSGFVNVDGALTKAMRKASKGESVLMFFDECLRWNESTQSFMLTFLNGFKKTVNNSSEKWYRLTTRNNNGIELETIEASAKNLHIVGGSNLTSDIPIEAFWSRFKKVRIDYSKQFATDTTLAIIDSYEIDDNGSPITKEKFVEWYASLIDESRKAVVDGSLQFSADFRLLENAINSSDGNFESIVSVLLDEKLGAFNDLCLWNSDNGNIQTDSLKALSKIYNKISIDNLTK